MPIRLEPTTPPEDLRPDDPTGLLATEQEEIDLQEGRVLNRAGRVIRSLFTADFDPMLHPRNRRGRFIETPDRPRAMASPGPTPDGMPSPAGLQKGSVVIIPKGTVFEDQNLLDDEKKAYAKGETKQKVTGIVAMVDQTSVWLAKGTSGNQTTKQIFRIEDVEAADSGQPHRFWVDSKRVGGVSVSGGGGVYSTKASCDCGEVFDDGNMGLTTAQARSAWRTHIKAVASGQWSRSGEEDMPSGMASPAGGRAATRAVAKTLGGKWTPEEGSYGSVDLPNGDKVWLDIEEDPDLINLKNIRAEPEGSGLGTKAIQALQAFAIQRDKPILATEVYEPSFFERLGFKADPESEAIEGMWWVAPRGMASPDPTPDLRARDLAVTDRTSPLGATVSGQGKAAVETGDVLIRPFHTQGYGSISLPGYDDAVNLAAQKVAQVLGVQVAPVTMRLADNQESVAALKELLQTAKQQPAAGRRVPGGTQAFGDFLETIVDVDGKRGWLNKIDFDAGTAELVSEAEDGNPLRQSIQLDRVRIPELVQGELKENGKQLPTLDEEEFTALITGRLFNESMTGINLLDQILNNPDRHAQNVLKDSEGTLHAIDHDFAFYDRWRNRRNPDGTLPDIYRQRASAEFPAPRFEDPPDAAWNPSWVNTEQRAAVARLATDTKLHNELKQLVNPESTIRPRWNQLIDEMAERAGLVNAGLGGMQSPMARPSGMASPAGGWTATDETDHPIYPSTMTGKAGQKVRVGDLLTLDGQEWEVAHILQGKVVLDEASGDKKKVEARVIDPKDTPGKPTELGGVKPAKPKKLVAGGKQTMHETSNIRMVEPYVESSTHDPTLALPKDSNLSEDQWEQFGLIEQMHYIDVMQRFGKWKSGAPIKQMVKDIEADFDSEIVNMVKQAHNSQYGSSSGGTLSLAGYSGTGESGKIALEQRSKGMDLQGRLRDLYAWDLYNRTRSPSLTVFHGSGDNVAWWKKLFKDRWLFSGLSQSFNIDASLGFGNTIVATALSIRHIVLATTVNNWLGMFGSEREIAIVPQVKVDPKRSMVFRFPELSIKARKFLQVETKQPRAGAWLERLREHIDKGTDLPIVIPPEIIMSQKSLKPPPPAALEAFADYKDIPEIKGEPYTPEQLKAKHGDLPFKHVDEKGRPEPRVAAEAGVKAGDFMIGMKGTLYWIGPDKTNNFGLRYHKIVKGSDGKLMFDGDSYAFEGDGANTYYFLKGNVQPLKDETGWDAAAWQFAAEDPVLIRNMQIGDKFKVDGTPYELTQVPSTMSISDDRITIRDLETGIQGTINADFATTRLVPATGYVAGQTLQPAKGMTLAYQGKKHTITSVKKDGIVSVKPAGGTVVQLAPDDPALKDLFDPSAWLPSAETTLQNLSVGEMFHGGSGKTVRPYKVIGKDGNKVEWQNMDNGKKGSSPKTKKVAVLKPQAGTPGEADHKPDALALDDPFAEGNTEPPPPPSDMPITKVVTGGQVISQEVAEQVGDVLLGVPAAELKEGTVIQHKWSNGMVLLYQVKKVDSEGAIIEQVSVEDRTGSGPVGKGSVSPENAMVVETFKLNAAETLGDFLAGKTEDKLGGAAGEEGKVFFYDTKLAAKEPTNEKPDKVTQVATLTDESAKAAAEIMADMPVKNLKVGVVFYDDTAKQYYKVQENNEGQVRILVSETPEGAPITELTLEGTEKLFGATPPPKGLIIYDLLDENEVAQEKVTVADEISDLPQAEIEPYKSAYGSGGKYKHDKIGEMTVGTIFQDKTGKLWAVQVTGANAVITDGVNNYSVDGDLRGKRLNEGLIEDAPVDAFALLNPPPAPQPVPHPYQEQKEVVPETPTSMIMDSMTPNQGMTVLDIAKKTNLESNAYYIYKGELFMIGRDPNTVGMFDDDGEFQRFFVKPDGEMVLFDTPSSQTSGDVTTWHSWETVPESLFVENEVLEEPTASETEPSGGELLKNVVDSTQTGYAEVEFEAGGKTFSVIAIGQKNDAGQQIYLKDMTTGEAKNIPLTDDLTLDGVAREFSEPPPTATSEAVTTPGLGPNFTAEEVAAAPKIELNFYKSAYGSGGKYKHEKVGDLPDGADFTVKGDKSKWVKVKSMTGGWVLVWKLHGSASELGLVKADGRVRAV